VTTNKMKNKQNTTTTKLFREKHYVCEGTCQKTYWTTTGSFINKGQRLYGRACINCDKKLTKKIVENAGVRYCETINGPVEEKDRHEHCSHVVCGVCVAMTTSQEARKPAKRART
jgi:hypothetical protein